ncbi:hypothetical protein ACFQ1S_44005 [Kibdelosporangium lantanae]|uniref:Uncharacterized protein n=1 Tax=Kibdelosporangium lantanae TaxID=1497396 RepID=A0ABW3MPI8_9PSEU
MRKILAIPLVSALLLGLAGPAAAASEVIHALPVIASGGAGVLVDGT